MKVFRITTLAALIACVPAAQATANDPAASSPTLTWNRIALESIGRTKTTQHEAFRLLAYLSLAQYAALERAGSAPTDDAVAAASAQVISGLMPAQAAYVAEQRRAQPWQASEHGQRVAQRVLAQARDDGFATQWRGQLPQAAYAWRSMVQPPAPPAYPAVGGMRTFLAESGSAFRSAPPPALGSSQFLADVEEVRRHTAAPTEETTRIAKFYDMTTGTMVAGYWNGRAAALMREHPTSELQAARVLATLNTAMTDAVVACHDAKYAYWVPRPSQADTSIKPLIGVPNHPSYPSNHSCVSTSAALVLAHFYPQARASLETSAIEAGVSRIYAGLHYRFDVDAGAEIGRKVAAAAITRHPQMLARWANGAEQAANASAVIPDKLRPDANETLSMIVPAKGVQIYECRAKNGADGQYEWAFVAPEADLFDAQGARIGRHYGGPHWEANDGSKIVGAVRERADAPSAMAIPWLLLGARSVGGDGEFSKVSSIQRVETSGGVAPANGCSRSAAGASARVAYTADYYFFARK